MYIIESDDLAVKKANISPVSDLAGPSVAQTCLILSTPSS